MDPVEILCLSTSSLAGRSDLREGEEGIVWSNSQLNFRTDNIFNAWPITISQCIRFIAGQKYDMFYKLGNVLLYVIGQ